MFLCQNVEFYTDGSGKSSGWGEQCYLFTFLNMDTAQFGIYETVLLKLGEI